MRDIIVIGASAGGLQSILKLLRLLPANLKASIFVVLHLRPESKSNLPAILRREGLLEAVFPRDGEEVRSGYIYVAPPNRHMIVEDGLVRVTDGPRENGARPAIDPLFHSAAQQFGQRVISILLSGSLDDGTAGMISVKAHGGIAIVQDPDEAEFNGMPLSAINSLQVDYVLPVEQIPLLLLDLVQETPDKQHGEGVKMPSSNPKSLPGLHFTCPDCGGVLTPLNNGTFVHFQCEVGHLYSPQTLLSDKDDAIEKSLWAAIRVFQEKERLAEHIASMMHERGNVYSASQFEVRSKQAKEHGEALKKLVTRLTLSGESDE